MRRPGLSCITAMLCASLAALASTSGAAAEARPIGWPALQGAVGEPAKGTDAAARSAWPLDGESVEIKGYALPVDRDGDLVFEFMLVPSAGACSHMAQPPPDQVIHVTAVTPFRMKQAYQFVSISGRIHLGMEKTQLFIMDGVAVIESGYSIGRAAVAAADESTAPMPARKSSPWSFIK